MLYRKIPKMGLHQSKYIPINAKICPGCSVKIPLPTTKLQVFLYQWIVMNYGKTNYIKLEEDILVLLLPKKELTHHNIIGMLLYYTMAVDGNMITSLNVSVVTKWKGIENIEIIII